MQRQVEALADREPRAAHRERRVAVDERGDLARPARAAGRARRPRRPGRARTPAARSIRSWRPVSATRIATLSGSTRARRTISRPDTRPMLTCGSKNSARSDAITMSPVVTRSRPAPQQRPLTADEHRLGHRPERRRGLLRRLPLRRASRGRARRRSRGRRRGSRSTSAPAQNARPLPVTIDRPHRVVGLGRGVGLRAARGPSCGLTALSWSGRLNVIVAMRSSTS